MTFYCKCGNSKSKHAEICRQCRNSMTFLTSCEATIGDRINKNAKYTSNRYNEIRRHAQKTMKFYKIDKQCKYCSHDLFTQVLEVAHIIPVVKFPLNTKLKVVNSLNNLEYQCPSHHRMINRGYVDVL